MTSRYDSFVGPILRSRSGDQDGVGGYEKLERSFASFASNGTPGTPPLGYIPVNAEVISVFVTPHSSQAGSATNYYDYKVIDLDSASAVVATKTLSAAGQGIAALARTAMTLSSSVASALGDGDHELAMSYAKAGNGIDMVPHSVTVLYRRR